MIFSISGLTRVYGNRTVLDIQALELEAGKIYALTGPNGAGKTTLLNILGFLDTPTTGRIVFDSRPVHYRESSLLNLRRQVAVVDQQPLLFSTTVFKNLEFGLKIRKVARRERQHRIFEALDMVGMGRFAGAAAHRLSGGETQRVALAARLALRPRVLLLDEPTANVDDTSALLIKAAALRARRQWGASLIIASHDRPWVLAVCDRVLHLFRGRLGKGGRKNMVFGPWQKLSGGRWAKQLPDGQKILVPRPPAADAVAQIPLRPVSGSTGAASPDPAEHLVRGVISQLALAQDGAAIAATILISDVTFTVRLDSQQVRRAGFYPGCRVWLRYKPEAVKWYPGGGLRSASG